MGVGSVDPPPPGCVVRTRTTPPNTHHPEVKKKRSGRERGTYMCTYEREIYDTQTRLHADRHTRLSAAYARQADPCASWHAGALP